MSFYSERTNLYGNGRKVISGGTEFVETQKKPLKKFFGKEKKVRRREAPAC